MSVKEMKNKKFGRLLVLERVENNKYGCARWLCKCDCGTTKVVLGQSLRNGSIVSCGCYQRDNTSSRQTKHGESKTRLYREWQQMKSRCTNPNYKFYSYYGGRGITIADEWMNDYTAFRDWSLANGYSEKLTLDRISQNGNYEPSNCRWVSRKVQQNNTRRCRYYTINGDTKTISEWSRIYGVPVERTRQRVVDRGWDIEKALTTPKLTRGGNPVSSCKA